MDIHNKVSLVNGRNHQRLQRLLHGNAFLLTQWQHDGGNALGNAHTLFEVFINESSIELREFIQMDAIQSATEVFIQLVGKERSERSQQLGNGHQALVQGLISSQLVVVHLLAPEALLVQTNIPVREVFVDKSIDESSGTCGIITVHLLLNTLNQRVQTRENPTVKLRTLADGNLRCLRVKAVHVGIHRKERIRII